MPNCATLQEIDRGLLMPKKKWCLVVTNAELLRDGGGGSSVANGEGGSSIVNGGGESLVMVIG